jgi:colicin import membrane protein
MPKKA